ncbi:MerR family transcriptional regulator [Ciceribacter sp. RN22]|uniref:MerR family transcriptional regulator n=1 Tax=Ciceribacter sp. RN22 TaxID=2954932 RepID=UPI002093C5D3|nr:MerR family transcriptional regulator [Ciceribacter sp. RN22]MCO6178667.1 MerR family transcriptional regulator [Ciceribacter sp. RN22]
MAERLQEGPRQGNRSLSSGGGVPGYLPQIPLPGNVPAEPVAIADMANMFRITHRTLHFYEEKGLIKAGRIGLMRVYTHADIARMALINACREIGMPVAVIQELMVELATAASEEDASAIFQQALVARKRELIAALSTIRRQMQQIIALLSPDGAADQASVADLGDGVELSDLERRCLELIAEGYTPTRIARTLDMAGEEITAIEATIIRKFDASNRFQAVAKAVLSGVIAS